MVPLQDQDERLAEIPDGDASNDASLNRVGRPVAILWRNRGLLLAVVDVVVICFTFLATYYLRFHVEFLAIKQVPVADIVLYWRGAAVLSSLWIFFIWRDGGYVSDLRGVDSLMVRYRSLLHSGIFAMAALMSISFLYREFLLSRQVYIMTAVLSCVLMALVRLGFRGLDRLLAARGLAAHRIVLVGAHPQVTEISNRLRTHGTTVKVTGVIEWEPSSASGDRDGQRLLGDLSQLESIHARSPFETIIVCSVGGEEKDVTRDGAILTMINFCEKNGISAYLSPGSFDIAVTRQEVGSLSGAPLIRIQDAALHPLNAVMKRAFDVVFSTITLLVTLPLWPVIALAIKVFGKGPVFFRQVRAGLHGEPFTMYKFRSMVVDAEAQLSKVVDLSVLPEPVFKLARDPRVTPVGRFLRRLGLDELPQLLNVLRGNMSLVGPRPEELAIVARYDPWQRRRLKAKPGITGYQQIMNRGEPALAERVKYDLIYLKHQSLLFDLYIVVRTIDVVLRGRGITH